MEVGEEMGMEREAFLYCTVLRRRRRPPLPGRVEVEVPCLRLLRRCLAEEEQGPLQLVGVLVEME